MLLVRLQINKLFISIFLILISFQIQADTWKTKTFFEDSTHQYWVGFSSFKKTEKDALNEARESAINELVKYNFGFYREEIETFSNTLKTKKMFQESINKNNNVLLKKILVDKKDIIKENNMHKAFVLIKYDKKELKLELARIESSKFEDKSKIKNFNSKINFNFLINTNVDNAKVTLISKNNSNDSLSTISGNPVSLPSGEYYLVMEKNGYATIKKDIVLSPSKLNLYIKMYKENIHFLIDVFPKDSIVKLNNKEINPNDFFDDVQNIDLDQPITIKVKRDNYFEVTKNTTLRYIKDNVLKIRLEPKGKNYSFTSNPEGATVFINGEKIGETPILNYKIHNEEFSVNLIKKDYKMVSKNIVNKEKTFFNFNLTKK